MEFSEIYNLYHIKNARGCPNDEIETAVKKWGALPRVLIEYYRQLGGEEDLNNIQDILCSPAKLRKFDNYLCFYQESQGSMDWCIKIEDLNADNPPVFCRKWINQYVYLPECPTMIDFLNAMAFTQALYALPFNNEGVVVVPVELVENIKAHYSKKPFGFSVSPQIEFYSSHNDDVICLIQSDGIYQMQYASSSQVHYDELVSYLGGTDK